MKRMKYLLAAVAVLATLSGCANMDPNYGGMGLNKQTGGALLGGAAGGLAGSQIGGGKGNMAAIIAGTLLGAGLGQSAGSSLDRADQMYQQRQMQGYGGPTVMPYPPPNNYAPGYQPNTYGPPKTNYSNGEPVCAPTLMTVYEGGQAQQVQVMACRDAYGRWTVR